MVGDTALDLILDSSLLHWDWRWMPQVQIPVRLDPRGSGMLTMRGVVEIGRVIND